MRSFAPLFLSICFSIFLITSASAQQSRSSLDPAKRQLIVEVLQSTGGIDAMNPAIQSWLNKYRQAYPKISEDSWGQIRQEITSEMLEMTIQTWAHYYSDDDLHAYLSFYSSASGKKLMKTRGPLTRDVMKGGEAVGAKMDAMVQQMVNGRTATPVPQNETIPARH